MNLYTRKLAIRLGAKRHLAFSGRGRSYLSRLFYYTYVCVLPARSTRSSWVGLGTNVGLYSLGPSCLTLNKSLFNVCSLCSVIYYEKLLCTFEVP